MAINNAQYLVTRDIALRTGELQNHYRTADGRFILDSRALQLIRFTPDEYISGLKGVERITTEQAKTLIAQGGYKLGDQDNDFGTDENAEAPKVEAAETGGISEDDGEETEAADAEENAEDAEDAEEDAEENAETPKQEEETETKEEEE